MSNSVRPHRRQPTRLRHPWDSPGKNTGVGCHFLFQCMKVKSEREVAQSRLTLRDPMDCSPPGSSVHGILHKSTGVGRQCLLLVDIKCELRIEFKMFSTCLVAQSSPTLCDPLDCCPPGYTVHCIFQARILEWVTISSSMGSFPPRNQIRVSWIACIVSRFFTC